MTQLEESFDKKVRRTAKLEGSLSLRLAYYGVCLKILQEKITQLGVGPANYSTVNTPILLTYLLTYPTHNESPGPTPV